MNRQAIQTFARCLSADNWPGYADGIVPVGLPAWEKKKIDEFGGADGETAATAHG